MCILLVVVKDNAAFTGVIARPSPVFWEVETVRLFWCLILQSSNFYQHRKGVGRFEISASWEIDRASVGGDVMILPPRHCCFDLYVEPKNESRYAYSLVRSWLIRGWLVHSWVGVTICIFTRTHACTNPITSHLCVKRNCRLAVKVMVTQNRTLWRRPREERQRHL